MSKEKRNLVHSCSVQGLISPHFDLAMSNELLRGELLLPVGHVGLCASQQSRDDHVAVILAQDGDSVA